MNQGYEHLKSELDIIKLLKSIRSSKHAIWGLTTSEQRKLCRHQALLILKPGEPERSDSEDKPADVSFLDNFVN